MCDIRENSLHGCVSILHTHVMVTVTHKTIRSPLLSLKFIRLLACDEHQQYEYEKSVVPAATPGAEMCVISRGCGSVNVLCVEQSDLETSPLCRKIRSCPQT